MSVDDTAPPGSGVEAADVEVVDLAPAPPPVDAMTSAVLGILDRQPQQRTWVQSALLLGISLLIFAATGFFNDEPSRIVLLIGVLLFHELGHYIGMRLFNYQDVQMFFIPLFGAAVAGRSKSVQGYKEAIVILLGPLPGILLGTALAILAIYHPSELLRSASVLLLFINVFNLLPFMPLDGGRLLHVILFCRQPLLEAIFRVITGGLLAFVGWSLRGWMLGLAGLGIVIGTPHVFRLSRLAKILRGPLRAGEEMDLSERIPFEFAVPLIETVRQKFPRLQDPNTLAKTVRQVWERIHLRPPGIAASLALLFLYAAAFLAVPVGAVALTRPVTHIVSRLDAAGKPVRAREVRVWGSVRETTELNAQDQPHGRHVEYYPATDQIMVEGAFENGLRSGTWKFFGEQGNLESVREFRAGKMVDLPPEQKPKDAEASIQ